MMCSWLVLARLAHEDHLVDAALLVAAQVLAHLVGRADAPRSPPSPSSHDLGAEPVPCSRPRLHRLGVVALLAALRLVLGPDVGAAGLVLAEHVVVRERVPEEVRAFEAALRALPPRRGGT